MWNNPCLFRLYVLFAVFSVHFLCRSFIMSDGRRTIIFFLRKKKNSPFIDTFICLAFFQNTTQYTSREYLSLLSTELVSTSYFALFISPACVCDVDCSGTGKVHNHQSEGLFQLFQVNICARSSVSVLSLCAKLAPRLLRTLKISCPPFDKIMPNSEWPVAQKHR